MAVDKFIAHKVWNVIGGDLKVIRYRDDAERSGIDIFIGVNRPQSGVTTYSTINLSHYDIGLTLNYRALRTEFIGFCASEYDKFANVLSSCAFNIINDNYSCSPGTVYPNVISQYYSDISMKHILFAEPFLIDGLDIVECKNYKVAWLMGIPISDAELNYRVVHGFEALDRLFEENQIDIYDLNRPSVV